MDARRKATIGYELFKKDLNGRTLYSFKIYGPSGTVIPGMNCPLTFPSEAGARGCAEALLKWVKNQLQASGQKVEKHTV